MNEFPLPDNVQKTVLPNGLTVLSEFIPSVRSVAIGVWLRKGSRHETDADSGITHFVEHMVFKGTDRYSARDIAYAIDGLGGNLDAFTSKETTAFTAKVLDEHWPRALDVLGDMVRHPKFAPDEIEREKGVVLEELKMDEDNPDYLLSTIFAGSFWPDHGMGRPVIGTRDTISAFDQDRLRQFFSATFHARNLLVTAAGNIDHESLADETRKCFGDLNGASADADPPAPAASPSTVLHDKPSLEQAHLTLGVSAVSAKDPRRFAGFVLSTLLGGGFSSRLFQKIREEAGLAYSVYSDLGVFADAGCLAVGAGTAVEAVPAVLEYTMREFRDLKERPVPADELRRAKDHLKGSLMLSLESPGSRMANLARQDLYYGRVRSLDEVSEAVESVTAEQVQALANEWFDQPRIALSVLGNLGALSIDPEQLAC